MHLFFLLLAMMIGCAVLQAVERAWLLNPKRIRRVIERDQRAWEPKAGPVQPQFSPSHKPPTAPH